VAGGFVNGGEETADRDHRRIEEAAHEVFQGDRPTSPDG
jgi:hypothetical protein